MANKSIDERQQEERLSLAHARQQAAMDCIGQAAVVTSQIFNRWPDAIKFLRMLDEIHADTLRAIDESQQYIRHEIDANRARHS